MLAKQAKIAAVRLAHRLGYDIVPRNRVPDLAGQGISGQDTEIIRSVMPYTQTSWERLYALIEAVRYVVNNGIPGDIVECGVWRGGSIMAAAKTMLSLNRSDRHFYLFDTFEGMSQPKDNDVSFDGIRASEHFEEINRQCYASLEEVKRAVFTTGYDRAKFHFIRGRVEDTLPDAAPDTIALLRLDTDWYESTKHELLHLYPRLSRRGVAIIDDYGHWVGARKAVDEYILENGICMLLNRIDYTGRIGVKM